MLEIIRRPWALAALLLVCACAGVDPRPDYERAREEIRSTTGATEVHDPTQPPLGQAELDACLADGLGLEEATRLALLNNRRLQAGFLELGIARADYVQAGLLRNPSLGLAFLFPDDGGRVRWTAELVQSLAEIWRLPARRAAAAAELDRGILELSRFAGELVLDTRRTYWLAVGARAARALAEERHSLLVQTLAGVRRQVDEGAASALDRSLAESAALEAELTHQRLAREESSALCQLAALLSLSGDLLEVTLTDGLPPPALPEGEREQLVEASLERRPDLRAGRRALAAAAARSELERERWLPSVEAGLAAERPEGESESDLFLGPALALELPLFDQNRAAAARARLELERAAKELEAQTSEVRQEVRAAWEEAANAAGAAAFTRAVLLPQAEEAAELARKAYALGDTTVLALLAAQRSALEARRAELEARLEAILARLALERAAGAPLEALAPGGG